MTLTYLDTSAFMRNAESSAASCSERNTKIRPFIRQILGDTKRQLACSELTLLEFHDKITTNLRSQQLPDCTEQWWGDAREEFLERIHSKRVLVLPTPPRAALQVMTLVSAATATQGRSVRASDALHAHIAARWSAEQGEQVELVTCDGDFDAIVQIPGMGAVLSVRNLDVLAGTREGSDRRNQ